MRSRLGVVAALAVLAAVAGAFAIGRATAPPARSALTTTTVALPPELQSVRDAMRPFTGDWRWHGAGAHIDELGTGTAMWRVYRQCQDDPTPPCDRTDGSAILDGGAATFTLTEVDAAGAASGYVTSTSDPAKLPLGPLHVTLEPDDHLLFPGLVDSPLCGPRASSGCGA